MSNRFSWAMHLSASDRPAPCFHEMILALLPLLLGGELLLWAALVPVGLRGEADFAMFYTAGSMVRTGHSGQLYNVDVQRRFQDTLVSKTPAPYTHLPYEALLFVPLSMFSYRTAYGLFLFVNLVLATAAFRLIRPTNDEWLAAAIAASYFPISAAIADGQDSVFLLVIAGASWRLFARKKEWFAGGLLALGLFRFQIVLPVAGLMLLWKRWRFVSGFAAASIPVLALSTLVAGVDQMRLYGIHLVSLSAVAAQHAAGYSLSNSQLLRMVNLRAFFANIVPSQHAGDAITLIASLALMLWVGKRRTIDREHQFALAVAFSVLVSYHLFVYDLSILLIPLMAILAVAERGQSRAAEAAILILLVAVPAGILWRPFLLALPLIAFLLIMIRTFCRELEGRRPQAEEESPSCSVVSA